MTRWRAAWALERDLLLLALQFLTRLPVPAGVPWSDDLQVRSVKYYPMVGLLVGIIGAVVLWVAALWLPPSVAALLSLAATLLVTGALHEDGLADLFDGLGSGAGAERAMAIMRDSRVGTYGVLALGVTLGLKVAALAAMPAAVAGLALIAAHVLGRMACVHVIATTRYARATGSKFAAPSVTRDGYRWALATAVGLLGGMVMLIGPGEAFFASLGCIALAQAVRAWTVARLGGYTGDGLGAAEQAGELGVLLGVLAWL
jgi:adenosylcobinamide-GDP ribazoletransferase